MLNLSQYKSHNPFFFLSLFRTQFFDNDPIHVNKIDGFNMKKSSVYTNAYIYT